MTFFPFLKHVIAIDIFPLSITRPCCRIKHAGWQIAASVLLYILIKLYSWHLIQRGIQIDTVTIDIDNAIFILAIFTNIVDTLPCLRMHCDCAAIIVYLWT